MRRGEELTARLIWATRGRSWGFRFLLKGGLSDPLMAYERFRRRDRHPGHADEERDEEATRAAFFARADKLPLRMLGPVVEVDTERPVDVAALATRVAEAARRA